MSSVNNIKKRVIDELKWDPRIKADRVDVSVTSDGNVVLTGKVASYSAKNAAEQDLLMLQDVTSVKNELEVKHLTSVKPPFDGEIKSHIMSTLGSANDIDADQIDVSVQSGYAELSGMQSTYWKKMKAENLVSEVGGVIEIDNNIEVKLQEGADDKQIAFEISKALKHDDIDADQITIRVNNGVVSLSGKLPNWNLYNALLRKATFTKGVKDVNNDLIVKNYLYH